MNAARELAGSDFRVVLIDRNYYHCFQPLLYQVATAVLSPDDIAEPIRAIFKGEPNVEVVLGEVDRVQLQDRAVRLVDGSEFRFDRLVVAAGSEHDYFGHDEWSRFAPGLKSIPDALNIRESILLAFEEAERNPDPAEQRRLLTFVIVGAGPTGVELAGAIAEIATRAMSRDFRRIRPEAARILLVEAADRILPGTAAELSGKAQRQLEDLGVEILTGAPAEQVDGGGVRAGTRTIACANIVWAAGNRARRVVSTLKTETDRAGRARVGPDLALADDPNVFIIGDAAAAEDRDGQPLPALAPVAIQQGRYVGKLIRRRVAPEDRKPFRYRDRGMMATVGRGRAVASIRGRRFSGWIAWVLWSVVHVWFLIGIRNRLSVFLNWVWHYITFQRSARLITWRQQEGRAPAADGAGKFSDESKGDKRNAK